MSRINRYLLVGAVIGATIGAGVYIAKVARKANIVMGQALLIERGGNDEQNNLQGDPEVLRYEEILTSISRQEDTPEMHEEYARLWNDPEVRQLRIARAASRKKLDELVGVDALSGEDLAMFTFCGETIGAGLAGVYGIIALRRRDADFNNLFSARQK